MSINSVLFIFVFLPVCLVAYYLLPGRCKNIVLFLASLVFYAWGNPVYLILLLISVVFNYFCALEMQRHIEGDAIRAARITLLRGIIFNAAVLGFFKYYGFVLENINVILPKDIPIQELPLPLGISFFTFSVISYLVDVYRREAPARKDFIAFGVYVAFFAKIISGPIVRYVDMEEQLKNAKADRVFITHSGCEDSIIEEIYSYLKSLNRFEEILITRAGSVISSHCGPGTLGVLFIEGNN